MNWREGEPNNANSNEHCVQIRKDGLWNDENCDNHNNFICEKGTDIHNGVSHVFHVS